MGFDFNDFLQKREDKGIHVSYSVDIRVVEGLFKKIFAKKDQDNDQEDTSNDGQQPEDSGRDI